MTDVIYQINDGPKQLVENATSPLFVPLGETETIKAWVSRSKSYPAFDPDALAYIQRVEGPNGDNQPLEEGVRQAIDAFVVGAKADGIWDAIKASCILAGARTLDGALQPLVGPAPTNFNFVSGDYNRKTGLKGDGATKYLDAGRSPSQQGRDNQSFSVYGSGLETLTPAPIYIGALSSTTKCALFSTNTNNFFFNNNVTTASNHNSESFGPMSSTGFAGSSRASSDLVSGRRNGITVNVDAGALVSPPTDNFTVFAYSGTRHSAARLAFYHIGEALDLALLESALETFFARAAFTINTGLEWQGYDPDTIAYINAGYAAGGALA